jgi:hypothetical protein
VTISTNATQNMSCSAGVCSPTAKKAVLNVNDLTNMLAAGDVKITTGHGAVTITIAAPFSWTSSRRLTLDANFNVGFRAPVTVAGKGAVTITTNGGGNGGELKFFPGAKLDFSNLASKLTIQGKSYKLVKGVRSLAGAIGSNPDGAFALAGDYDAAHDGTYNGSAVATPFTGEFEGLGHEIANFSLKNCDQLGGFFFEVSDASGAIADITLSQAKAVSCKANSLGLLAGFSYGTIRNASVSGSLLISENEKNLNSFDVGGVAGGNDGAVTGSRADVSITCRKLGCKIDAQDYGAVGALVGRNFGAVESSFGSGSTFGWEGRISAGGLVGINDGAVRQSFSDTTVAVEGAKSAFAASAGGLAGITNAVSSISDSYAMGAVSAGKPATIGGTVGFVRSGAVVRDAYSIGSVMAPAKSIVGGFVGNDGTSGGLSAAYWDLNTSGIDDPSQGAGNVKNDPGITGLSDAQLKSGLPAGFDPAVWGQSPSINNGYPYLLGNPPPQ